MRQPPPTGRDPLTSGAARGMGRAPSGRPVGNTGGTQSADALRVAVDDPFAVGVDALSVTFFPWPSGREWHSRAAMASEASAWVGDHRAILFPSLTLGDEANGRYGYSKSMPIMRSESTVGQIRYGGNRGSISIEVIGNTADSLDVRQWELTARTCAEHRITRLDCAFDDFGSSYRTYSDWRRAALDGAFRAPRGALPQTREHDDHGRGTGRTLYVGSPASSRLIRIYEKGHQLGVDELPAWVRVEAQIRKHDRVISWDHVRDPAGTLRAIPGLVGLPVVGLPRTLDRARKIEELNAAERNIAWLRSAAGPSLRHVVRVLGAEGAAQFLQREGVSALERQGMTDAEATQAVEHVLGDLAELYRH